MEIVISVDENGKLNVKVPKNMGFVSVLGLMEIAKQMILDGKTEESNPAPELEEQ